MPDHISELRPDPTNAREHNARNVGMIVDALQEVGAARSIVIDENGRILAGNATIEAAAEAGIERVVTVDGDGETIVAVRRSGLTEEQKRRLAYFDNRTAELATWDAEQVMADVEAGVDLAGLFNEQELADVLAAVRPPAPDDPGAQIDRAEELRQKWGVELGQVWEIGRHRLACGDCTDAAVVEAVMQGERAGAVVTDPPYGVSYDGGTKQREELAGDDAPSLYFPFLRNAKIVCREDVAVYLFYADGDAAVTQAVTQAGFTVRNTLIWNKNQAQFGALSAQYKQKHEPFLYCHLRGKMPQWFGPTNEVTVWDVDRATSNDMHPTQKPPALFERVLRNSSRIGDIVLDGFLGSGTTFVACERLGRIGRGIELSPAYCAVTLERLAGMGLEPILAGTV